MPKCARIVSLALAAAALSWGGDPNAAAALRSFQAAEQAARLGDVFKAYLLYVQAAQLAPANPLYRARREVTRQSPALAPQVQLAPDPFGSAIAAKPQQSGMADGLTGAELADGDKALPPPSLAGTPGKQSLDLRGDSRMVIEAAANAFGIQVVFDAAYQPVPNVIFRINDVDYREALHAVEAATDSFLVPEGAKLVFVARDTQPNRAQLAPVMTIAVPVPERISAQDAQELATAVQQTLEIRRISLDPVKRMVYFRDAVSKVLAARQMLEKLSRLRAQIQVDVEFLSVSRSSALSYGLSLPTSAQIVDFSGSLGGIVNVPPVSTATGFTGIGGGASRFGIGIGASTVLATLAKSSSETILDSSIQALDAQAATLKVGSRYPIITGSFSGLTPGTTVSSTLSPSVNFEDLGLTLKITPTVHEEGEVTLDVDAEFKALGAGSSNGIPVIESRQYQGKVRLREGEWGVIAGLVSVTDAQTPTGIAGLSELPAFGWLFGQKTHNVDESRTLIILKPHLVSLAPWDQVTPAIRTGTESRPLTAF